MAENVLLFFVIFVDLDVISQVSSLITLVLLIFVCDRTANGVELVPVLLQTLHTMGHELGQVSLKSRTFILLVPLMRLIYLKYEVMFFFHFGPPPHLPPQ